MDNFLKKEIKEICGLNGLDFDEIYNNFIKTKLNAEDLKLIENNITRAVVYECLTAYPEELTNSGLIEKIYEILINMHDGRERGFLVERKVLLKLKRIFHLQNGDDYNHLYYKIAYVISKRLFFTFNGEIECEQLGEVELSLILQQILTDLMSYISTLQIKHRISVDFNDNHIKSLVLRATKLLSLIDEKIEIKLRKISNRTVYFIRSSYKTHIFFHFYARVLLSPSFIIRWKNLGLNGGYHYLNKRRIISSNIYNDYTHIKENIIEFVEKQNKLGFFLDKKMIKKQENEVVEQLKLDREINRKWGEYFSEIDDLSQEEMNEILNLEVYKKKLKKNQYYKELDNLEELKKLEVDLKKEKKTNKIKKLESKKAYLEQLIDKNILKFDPKIYNRWIQKDFSYAFLLKIYLDYIKFFENYNLPLYFTLYFDFRGRFYYNSMVSPAQGWPFRFIYYFETENHDDHSLMNIKEYKKEIELIEKKIGCLEIYQKQSLIWVLLSIGAITIHKKEKITEGEFVKEGLKNYLNRVAVDDLLENSELSYYYLIIDNYNDDKKNRYLLKDISGSIFQNGSIVLGIKDDHALEVLNINNKEWHDPYLPLINKIKERIKNKDLEKFFTRKTLKKSIMTRYYNAKLHRSFEYFIKEVKKIKEYDESLFNEIWKEFKGIYSFLGNLEKELIFDNSSSDYSEFLKLKKIDKIDFGDFTFSITSYTLTPSRIDIVVGGKRITTTTYKHSKKIYTQKTQNSRIPHVFHGEDSSRARNLILMLENKCFSIHDAFGVSHLKVDRLIIKANESFNINMKRDFYMNENKINKKLFSKFIIL